MSDAPPEHARYRRYLLDLEKATADDEPDLISTILGDPDRSMALAAVLHHIGRRADLLTDDQYATWSTRMAALVEGHDLLVQRLNDWTMLRAIRAGHLVDVATLADATDWLQREAAALATSPEILALLATAGRTRRVRTAADLRIHKPSR